MSFASSTYNSPNGYIPISQRVLISGGSEGAPPVYSDYNITKMGSVIDTEGEGAEGSFFSLNYSDFYDTTNSAPQFKMRADNQSVDPVINLLSIGASSADGFRFDTSKVGESTSFQFTCNTNNGFEISGDSTDSGYVTAFTFTGSQVLTTQPTSVAVGGDDQIATTLWVLNEIAALKTDPTFIAAVAAAVAAL
jgi:hypothetical protein